MLKRNKQKAPAIVRKYRKGGDTLIIFPREPGTPDPYTCACFQWVGQHGHGDFNTMIQITKPMPRAEAESELAKYIKSIQWLIDKDESPSYQLRARASQNDHKARHDEVKAQRLRAILDEFTTAYLHAGLWSSNDESDPETGGEPLDSDYDICDFTGAALESAIADCKAFQEKYGHLWRAEGAIIRPISSHEGGPDAQAGHDFWLTRNGHGAGFWDGDYKKSVGEKLSAACGWQTEFSTCHIFVTDAGQLVIERG